LNVSRGSIKQFEDNVNNLRLAGPGLDKWQLDSVYTSIIVPVFECGVEDSLDGGF
jgi:hypothetical protein